MRCRHCNYPLAELVASQCPECGNAFDPSNPSTLRDPHHVLHRAARLATVCVALFPFVPWLFALLAACNARVELGRWPRPNTDDPKGLRLAAPFDECFRITFWLAIAIWFVLPAITIFWIGACLHRRSRQNFFMLLIALCGIALPFVILEIDPWRAIGWMLD